MRDFLPVIFRPVVQVSANAGRCSSFSWTEGKVALYFAGGCIVLFETRDSLSGASIWIISILYCSYSIINLTLSQMYVRDCYRL
jgi:hypothetical protein